MSLQIDITNGSDLNDAQHYNRRLFTAKRALVVEDNPTFQKQIIAALEQVGTVEDIICCHCGEQLQALLPTSPRIDLALVDLGLPDIAGTDVIHSIREVHPTAIIMVISVFSNQSAVISAIRAGARGYILKGENTLSIADAIRDIISGHCPISPSIARYLFALATDVSTPLNEKIELTPRERETLSYIANGYTYSQTAMLMELSLSTVQTNIRNLYRKLGAHSQVQAINKARSTGLI